MNPHSNYVAVGLFLIIGVISVVVLIIWLGKAGDTAPKDRYVVSIDGPVTGLSNGSIVRYLGVNVGTVVDIVLYTEADPVVEVFIEVQEGLPIDDSTYATLVSQGVTGIANIDLSNFPDMARPQVIHPSGVPVIPFRPSGLSAFLAGSGDVTEDLRRLLARLNAWAGEENRIRAEEFLENLRLISASLADQRHEIPELVASLKGIMASLERTAVGLEKAVGDDWPVIAADLKATTENLASASARIDTWLVRNEASVNRLLGQGFDEFTGLVLDLREVSEQLSRLSARLREDPSRVIYRPQRDPVVAEP